MTLLETETYRGQHRLTVVRMWLGYLAVLGTGLMVGAIAYKRSAQLYFGASFALLVGVLVIWWFMPRLALGLSVLAAVVGDTKSISWYPTNKNLSSYESIMYVSGGISISPLEISIGVGLAAIGVRNVAAGRPPFRLDALTRPFAIYLTFVVLGFINGVYLQGGNLEIALVEMRPMLYLPMLYLLITNVCRTRRDYNRIFGAAIVGIAVHSVLSLLYYTRLDPAVQDDLESLGEHGGAIGMNLVFAVAIAALALRGVPVRVRWLMLAVVPVVLYVYVISQRRAAFVALCGALMLFGFILFLRQRRTFWKLGPAVIIIIFGYTGAFWNAESGVGFAAQAIKSVVAPDSTSEKDQSSDLYREIEKYDLSYTIRDEPLLGQGFGKKFLRPIPLPDISSFELYEYLPHNSVLWVWIKTGFFGFAALLYLLARTLALGTRRALLTRDGVDSLVASAAVMFVMMFAIYLWVEIAWEARNVLLLSLSMALCTGELQPKEQRTIPTSSSELGIVSV